MTLPLSIPLTLKVDGLDQIHEAIDALRLAYTDQLQTLRLELTTRMATMEEQVAALNAAADGIAGDIQRIKDELSAAVADKDQAVQDAVQNAANQLDGVVSRLQSLDAENPAPEPTPEPQPEPEPEQPVNP